MNQITNTTTTATMTSWDLRELINTARKEFGEPSVENSHFLKRVEDELGGELGGSKTFRPDWGGAPIRYYDLTLEQCLLVGMRESKAVRRQVLYKLKELEQQVAKPQLPDFTNPVEAARAWADEVEKKQKLEIAMAEAQPKVEHYDRVAALDHTMNITMAATKLGMSAKSVNKVLDKLNVYNKSIVRSRVFNQWFIDAGYGVVRQTSNGFTQSLLTIKGEMWLGQQLSDLGLIPKNVKPLELDEVIYDI